MEMRKRVKQHKQLLIGLDAAEWELVTKWAGEGKLPTIQRLMACGARGRLASTSAQLPDTIWGALCTGVNPAKVERYFYVQYDAQTLGLRHVPDEAVKRATFWDYLSQAGLCVGIVDVPKFAVSRSLQGFQLANWGVHPAKAKPASFPASLLKEVEARFGSHPVGQCDAVDSHNPASLRRLRDRFLAGIQTRGRMIRCLMQERPWDLFFAVFSETHCAGHQLWGFFDPPPNQPLTEEARDLADGLEQVYRAVDRELGEILALAGAETQCLVFAAHGMGRPYHASWNLPEILNLLGYGRDPAAGTGSRLEARPARVNPWRILKMIVPGQLQYWIKERLPQAVQDELIFRWYAGDRKWEGCRAFAVPNNESVGAIRISVRGRDRHGIVEPGPEYRQVCREITEALYELTDVPGGRPIVKQVTFTPDKFSGPFLDQLPDLTVLWEQAFPWHSIYSPRFGALQLRLQDVRSGNHTTHGFMFAMGPGVPAGVELNEGSIYDIAPTVLEAAGLPIPADFEGRSLLCELVDRVEAG